MNNFTLIDLEWTSWKDNYFGEYLEKEKRKRWQKREIIQIGALKFDQNFNTKKLLDIIVKPKINKNLSQHMTNLTSLTDKIIDEKGLSFLMSYKKLIKFSKNSYVLSNGIDGKVLRENLVLNQSKLKIIQVLNIKRILEKEYHIPKKYLSSPLIKTFFGQKFNKKKAHHAVEDCKSVIYAMKKMKFDLNFIKKRNFYFI